MGRLTEFDSTFGAYKARVNWHTIYAEAGIVVNGITVGERQEWLLGEIVERLAAYEDSGLEPEDVKKIHELLRTMRDTGQFDLLQRLIREEKERIGRNNDA